MNHTDNFLTCPHPFCVTALRILTHALVFSLGALVGRYLL